MINLLNALEQWEEQHLRHRQVVLGPSDVDRCLRQSAYQLHGYDETDTQPREKAMFGSLLHLGWAEVIRSQNDPQHQAEVPIEIPGLLRGGTADDVDFRSRVVTDLKTAGDRAWERYVSHGLPDRMWDQAEVYAYGLWLAEQTQRQIDDASLATADAIATAEPWTLAIMLLNRETGRFAPFEQAADPERGARLVQRLARRQQELAASASPDDIQREGDGPETGFPCDWCPFMSACWPQPDDDSELSPQALTIADDPYLIEAALNEYLVASGEEGKARKVKEQARAYLTGLKPDTYGAIILTWRGGRELPPEPDGDAAVRMLQDMGIEPPTKTRRTAKQINVKRTVKRAGE